MSNAILESEIEAAWSVRDTINPSTKGKVREAIEETLEALKIGKVIALASKEIIVSAQSLLDEIKDVRQNILPVDSEPNAIWQCIEKESNISSPVYMETACISAIEAMSAKCMVVCPNLGALPETCANFAWMYGYEPAPEKHIAVHSHILGKAIETYRKDETQVLLNLQKTYLTLA